MVITRSLHRSNKKRLRIKKATTFLVFVIIVQNDLANIFYTQICSVYPTNTLLLGILFEIIYPLKGPDYTLIFVNTKTTTKPTEISLESKNILFHKTSDNP
jgi:hypothetical protein